MKYSIIIVTRNSAEDLPACLEAIVRNSGDEEYEVIIIDNDSDDYSANIFHALEGDVKILRNEFNLGFARASNMGIEIARGEFIVLLNPDTVVTPDWLKKMSSVVLKRQAGAVGPLSDYVAGMQKYELHLPAEISGETPTQINRALELEFRGNSLEAKFLIGFCMMIHRPVIDKIGLLDDDLVLGNEDLEYSLRLKEAGYELAIALDTFIHHRGQASFRKDSAADRWVNLSAGVLAGKLKRKYGKINPKTIWGMDWFKPEPDPEQDLVSIVIPTYNGVRYTEECLNSIRRSTFHPYEIIAVDNGSSDGTVEYLKAQPEVKLIANPANRGYPAACNQGIMHSQAPYVMLLNNDIVVTDFWLSRMFQGFFADRKTGLIGPRSNDSAGSQKVSSTNYDKLSDLGEYAGRFKRSSSRQFRRTDYLSGFCLLVERRVFQEIGLFDERFGIGNYEDEDFCRRAVAAGYSLLIANEVYIHHHGSKSFIENGIPYHEILEENRMKFEAKWSPGA